MTIIFQIGLLAAVPIPSPVSSRRMWGRRRDDASPGDADSTDPFAVRLLPVVAVAGLLAVVATLVWPGGAGGLLLPAGVKFPSGIAQVSAICLLAGNGLIASAVFALKGGTRFDDAGQCRRLVTGGVFSLMRHPIVGGMGLIYLGFFLALPSPLVLVGLGCYGWHQQRRLAAEEALLAEQFGRPYQDYRRRVGRFGPKRFARGRG